MLAGHPRDNGRSNYEMEIRARRASDGEQPIGAGGQKSVSWVRRENSSLQSLLKQMRKTPRKGSQKKHTEASPNH